MPNLRTGRSLSLIALATVAAVVGAAVLAVLMLLWIADLGNAGDWLCAEIEPEWLNDD